MVPILNDYIEASASPQKDIHNMKLERVEHTDKKLYILSFSCHEDLCSYIILDRSGDNQAILLADIASLEKMSPSPDDTKLLLRFERETTLPLPLSDIVVIDTENWQKLAPKNITDNTDPLEYSWPLLDADWSDDEKIRVSKPDKDKPTEKGIKKWKVTEQHETTIKIYNIKIEPITEGGPFMTVATQVKQTISGLKSAQASLEQFALETENQQAKQLFQTAAQQTQTVVDSIEPRMTQIEQEEPQYKQQ